MSSRGRPGTTGVTIRGGVDSRCDQRRGSFRSLPKLDREKQTEVRRLRDESRANAGYDAGEWSASLVQRLADDSSMSPVRARARNDSDQNTSNLFWNLRSHQSSGETDVDFINMQIVNVNIEWRGHKTRMNRRENTDGWGLPTIDCIHIRTITGNHSRFQRGFDAALTVDSIESRNSDFDYWVLRRGFHFFEAIISLLEWPIRGCVDRGRQSRGRRERHPAIHRSQAR